MTKPIVIARPWVTRVVWFAIGFMAGTMASCAVMR